MVEVMALLTATQQTRYANLFKGRTSPCHLPLFVISTLGFKCYVVAWKRYKFP